MTESLNTDLQCKLCGAVFPSDVHHVCDSVAAPRVASSVDDLRAGQWVAWRVKTRRRWVVGEIIEPDQQWVEGMLILEDDPDD